VIPSFFWACAPLSRSWTDRGRTLWISEPMRLLTVMSVTLTGTAHRLHLNLENQDACAAIRSSLRRSDLEAAFRDGVTVSRATAEQRRHK
jgi:hypothetical protein